MAEINTRNPEPRELVGSTDLRQAFKDNGGRIRGSFFINDIEMHQFEANTPGSVVSQINAKTGAHFVTAEIDDGGHLVLIDRSGADIRVRAGEPYHDLPPPSTGNVGADVATHLKKLDEDRRREDDQPSILELLGLPDASDHTEENATPAPGFETGLSAEDRKKRWQDETGQSDGTQQNLSQPARQGGVDKRGAPQIPSNPTPGVGTAGGQLEDGRGRSGTGGGQGETAARTIQDQHSGASQKPAPVPAG